MRVGGAYERRCDAKQERDARASPFVRAIDYSQNGIAIGITN